MATEELSELSLVEYKYRSGIPTLRSSKHRVRTSKQNVQRLKNSGSKSKSKLNNNKSKPHNNALKETLLPPSIRRKECFPYNAQKHNLGESLITLLSNLNSEWIGTFQNDRQRLEDLDIPTLSLTRNINGGNVEDVQQYLSDAIHNSEEFLSIFDLFVTDVILPHLKQRLIDQRVLPSCQQSSPTKVTFYYQRPPTLRLQPGPARAMVNTHRDSMYGHQGGELNFFIPLTDRSLTGVDLHCESDANVGDYQPLGVDLGHWASFHGSSCRHFVNRNESVYTRASLDFRVGVSPFYDDSWMMVGTSHDHLRRKVEM